MHRSYTSSLILYAIQPLKCHINILTSVNVSCTSATIGQEFIWQSGRRQQAVCELVHQLHQGAERGRKGGLALEQNRLVCQCECGIAFAFVRVYSIYIYVI